MSDLKFLQGEHIFHIPPNTMEHIFLQCGLRSLEISGALTDVFLVRFQARCKIGQLL